MLAYTSIGTNNLAKAEAFFDEIFPLIKGEKFHTAGRSIFYRFGQQKQSLCITMPYNKQAATSGNGNMIALAIPDNDLINAVHKKALELGGTCEGVPGERHDGSYYAAYFRDLDGNKFSLFHQITSPN